MSAAAVQGPSIAVVDYGMGNRRSVEKALEHVGARAIITSDHDALRAADGLIVPGVGAFPRAIESLRALGLDELIRERVDAGVAVLGICLGMQLAFEHSQELGGAEGLGIIAGEVRELEHGALKLPHIGWTDVHILSAGAALADGLPEHCAFYHVHSYAAVPADPSDVLATASYGGPFVTAVQRGSFVGVQFHPEKSSTAGLRMLANFARMCAGAAAAGSR